MTPRVRHDVSFGEPRHRVRFAGVGVFVEDRLVINNLGDFLSINSSGDILRIH
jgi:hypothetical protein